ncbi:MAG: helix-turn-helix domain-containing protein [Actinomycetes bacterium]
MQEMQDRHAGRELLTADAVAQLFHVDASTVYRMAGDGRLPAVKVGRQWRFPADRIARLLEVDEARSSSTVAPVPPSATLDADRAQPVVDVAAELLGVMMVVTDMHGQPLTSVANPCPWFGERAEDPDLVRRCVAEWHSLAEDLEFEPRFRAGSLGFECARAFVRDGAQLVGMVLAGGVAPDDQPADGLYALDPQHRQHVLATLPKVAATLSRVAQTSAATHQPEGVLR